jgi:hypothetical protein
VPPRIHTARRDCGIRDVAMLVCDLFVGLNEVEAIGRVAKAMGPLSYVQVNTVPSQTDCRVLEFGEKGGQW